MLVVFFFVYDGALIIYFFFFSRRRRHTRWNCDWSSDVCSSDLLDAPQRAPEEAFAAPFPEVTRRPPGGRSALVVVAGRGWERVDDGERLHHLGPLQDRRRRRRRRWFGRELEQTLFVGDEGGQRPLSRHLEPREDRAEGEAGRQPRGHREQEDFRIEPGPEDTGEQAGGGGDHQLKQHERELYRDAGAWPPAEEPGGMRESSGRPVPERRRPYQHQPDQRVEQDAAHQAEASGEREQRDGAGRGPHQHRRGSSQRRNS